MSLFTVANRASFVIIANVNVSWQQQVQRDVAQRGHGPVPLRWRKKCTRRKVSRKLPVGVRPLAPLSWWFTSVSRHGRVCLTAGCLVGSRGQTVPHMFGHWSRGSIFHLEHLPLSVAHLWLAVIRDGLCSGFGCHLCCMSKESEYTAGASACWRHTVETSVYVMLHCNMEVSMCTMCCNF